MSVEKSIIFKKSWIHASKAINSNIGALCEDNKRNKSLIFGKLYLFASHDFIYVGSVPVFL